MRAQRLGLEAPPLGVAREHPVDVARPQAGLVAAGAGADLDDHVLLVVGVALDHREPDLLAEHLHALPRGLHLLPQLRIVAALGEHLLGAVGVGLGMPPCLGELGRRGELVEEAPRLGVALPVPDHLGIRHLRLRILETGLDLLDERFDHGPQDPRRRPPCPPCPRRTRCAGPRRRALPPSRRSRRRAASRSGSRVVSFCSCMPGHMTARTQRLRRLRPANLMTSKERPGDQRHAEDPRGDQPGTRRAAPAGRRRRWPRSSRSAGSSCRSAGAGASTSARSPGVSGSPASKVGDDLVLGAVVLEHAPQVVQRESSHR